MMSEVAAFHTSLTHSVSLPNRSTSLPDPVLVRAGRSTGGWPSAASCPRSARRGRWRASWAAGTRCRTNSSRGRRAGIGLSVGLGMQIGRPTHSQTCCCSLRGSAGADGSWGRQQLRKALPERACREPVGRGSVQAMAGPSCRTACAVHYMCSVRAYSHASHHATGLSRAGGMRPGPQSHAHLHARTRCIPACARAGSRPRVATCLEAGCEHTSTRQIPPAHAPQGRRRC